MSKIDALGPLASLENQTSAIQTINENADKIETAFENTLSRDGSGPNQMEAPLDMNSQRILNLPAPTSDNDPARWTDVKDALVLTGETVIPSLVGNANKFLTNDGSALEWKSPVDFPTLGDMKGSNNLSELTNVPTARTNLGLGSAATAAVGTVGDVLIKANTNNTLSGNNSHTGTNTFTGSNSITGSGDLTLDNTTATLGTKSVGFRGAPVEVRDANYTWTLDASGFAQLHTSGSPHTYTIPPSVFPVGHFVSVINVGAGAVAVNRGAGVSLQKLGSGANANISVAQWGSVTLFQYALNSWIILSSVNVT